MTDVASTKKSLRGYMFSRPFYGMRYPHRVQNLMIREYCNRKGLVYQMSGIEVSVPNGHHVLWDIIAQQDAYDGIAFFSVYTLPTAPEQRKRVYELLNKGKTLHFCLEQIDVAHPHQLDKIEDLLAIRSALIHAPLSGTYQGMGEQHQQWLDYLQLQPNQW